MSELTEGIYVGVSSEKKEEIKKKAKDGPYSGMADYVRSMMRAGESNIADLDPRTSNNHGADSEIDSLTEAVNKIGAEILLNQLSEEPKEIDEVFEKPTNEFQTELAQKLKKMEQDPDSPVQHDVLEGYYLE